MNINVIQSKLDKSIYSNRALRSQRKSCILPIGENTHLSFPSSITSNSLHPITIIIIIITVINTSVCVCVCVCVCPHVHDGGRWDPNPEMLQRFGSSTTAKAIMPKKLQQVLLSSLY